jgi:hypothetical protein
MAIMVHAPSYTRRCCIPFLPCGLSSSISWVHVEHVLSVCCCPHCCRCGPALLGAIFKVDVSSELLAALLQALAHRMQQLQQGQQHQQRHTSAGASTPAAAPAAAGPAAPLPPALASEEAADAGCTQKQEQQAEQQRHEASTTTAQGDAAHQQDTTSSLAASQQAAAASAQQEAVFVLDVLSSLTSAGRFGLAVRLLSSKVKAAVQQMFSQLEHCLQDEAAFAADVPLGAADASVVREPAARLRELRQQYGCAQA